MDLTATSNLTTIETTIATTITTTTIAATTQMTCAPPLVFTSCMKTCSMCHYLEPNCVISKECHTGCDCPGELVFDGVKCVKAADCKCVMTEVAQSATPAILKPGETAPSSSKACTEYVCLDNKLVEKPKACTVCDPNTEKAVMVEGQCCATCEKVTPVEQSPAPETCTGGKIPTKCSCTETCQTKAVKDFKCPTGDACRNGCQCVEGYVEDINGACIKAKDCKCYEPVNDIFLKLNDPAQIKNKCGSVTHLLCTQDGIKSTVACEETCGENHIPAMVDAAGCCVCKSIVPEKPEVPKVDACANTKTVICDLPCDSPADMTCMDFVKQPEAITKGRITFQDKTCTCPATYTPEVSASGADVLLCTKRMGCTCMHGGKTFTSGEQFSEMTPSGQPIDCRTCTCVHGQVSCGDVPQCLMFTSITTLPVTTPSNFSIAVTCAETGCFDDGACHSVNETWSKANCVSCKCTAPRTTVCEVTRCPTVKCDASKNEMEIKLKMPAAPHA